MLRSRIDRPLIVVHPQDLWATRKAMAGLLFVTAIYVATACRPEAPTQHAKVDPSGPTGSQEWATVGPSQGRPPLLLTIESKKEVYVEGEPIDLVATLKNSGKAATRIYSPGYWGVSEIVVEDATGVRISPRRVRKRTLVTFPGFWVIPQGEERSHTFRDLTWDLCGSAPGFDESDRLLLGIYSVYVTVTNPPVYGCAEDVGNPRRSFEKTDLAGTLTSNKIILRIEGARTVHSKQEGQKIVDAACEAADRLVAEFVHERSELDYEPVFLRTVDRSDEIWIEYKMVFREATRSNPDRLRVDYDKATGTARFAGLE